MIDSHSKISAWHSPTFDRPLCGTFSDRERLGLPDHYVDFDLSVTVARAYAELRRTADSQLMDLLADSDSTLACRLAAGNLLALSGDPRIHTSAPEMIAVPSGRVEIGLEPDEIDAVMARFSTLGLERTWIEKESPRHSVQLAPYRIARYPVTNAEYRDFLIETGFQELPSSWEYRQYPQHRSNHPVYTVSEKAADAYAKWLARRTERGFRLPSEAEWEWAATGPDGREYPWGSHFEPWLANTAETGLFATSPVGVFTQGDAPFGASDMAGNVEEFVSDSYAAYPGGNLVTDHLFQINGSYRVARGGSFARFRDLARTRRRHGHNTRSATYAMGFRLAETV